MIGSTGVVQPQPIGAEQESQHGLLQWARKLCQRPPRWQVRHLPQTGLQPESQATAEQLTGAPQLTLAVQPQPIAALHELPQPLPQPNRPPWPNSPQPWPNNPPP